MQSIIKFREVFDTIDIKTARTRIIIKFNQNMLNESNMKILIQYLFIVYNKNMLQIVDSLNTKY